MSSMPPIASPAPAAPASDASPPGAGDAFDLVRDVEVEVTLEIGRRRMKIGEVLRLAPGQTLSLSKAAGDPIELYVNGRLLGRGEAVVVGDRYGVRITEVVRGKAGAS